MFARCTLVLIAVFVGLDGLVLALGSLWFGDSMTAGESSAALVVGLVFVLVATLVPQSQRGIATHSAVTKGAVTAISVMLLALTPIIVRSDTIMSTCTGEIVSYGHPWLDTAGALILLGWLVVAPRTHGCKPDVVSCVTWKDDCCTSS